MSDNIFKRKILGQLIHKKEISPEQRFLDKVIRASSMGFNNIQISYDDAQYILMKYLSTNEDGANSMCVQKRGEK